MIQELEPREILEKEVQLVQEERREIKDTVATRGILDRKECKAQLDQEERREEKESLATQDTKERRDGAVPDW